METLSNSDHKIAVTVETLSKDHEIAGTGETLSKDHEITVQWKRYRKTMRLQYNGKAIERPWDYSTVETLSKDHEIAGTVETLSKDHLVAVQYSGNAVELGP